MMTRAASSTTGQQKTETKQKKSSSPDGLRESLPDSAWTCSAIELFADELRSLEVLEEEEDKLHQKELRRIREWTSNPTFVLSRSVDGSPGSQEKRSTPRVKRSPLMKRGTLEKSSMQGSLGIHRRTSPVTIAQNLLRMVKEEELAVTRRREEEFWRQRLQGLQQQMQNAHEESEIQRAFSNRQLRFFMSRNIDEFMMDEILQGTAAVPTKSKCSLLPIVSKDPCNKGGAQEEGEQLLFSDGLSPFVPSSTAACGNTVENAKSVECDYLIDALGFANNVNTRLEKEYGFCPFTRSCPSVKESTRAALSHDEMREKLLLHAPGDIMGVTELCASHMLFSASPPTDKTCQAQGQSSHHLATHRNGKDERKTRGVVLPPISSGEGTMNAVTRTETATVEGNRSGDFSPNYVCTGHPVGSKTSVTCIECSAVENRVKLQANTGLKTSTRVRFINRDVRLLRLRLRPSNHAWLTYSVERSSLGPPLVPLSGVCTTLSEPLRSGGFVDVKITFEPRSVAEPSFTEVLQLGYCRETNSFHDEMVEWHFFDVVVNCETILPEFRLIPVTAEENQTLEEKSMETSSRPKLISFSSYGKKSKHCFRSSSRTNKNKNNNKNSHLKNSEHGILTCEFPYTFVMDSSKRRFYLENIGSSAFVRLSSTSPYFKIDSSLETGILLSCGERIETTICFAPLKEARYEAEQLLVTAWDVNDGPIISTHRFGLSGEGILPHVELVRIGPLKLRQVPPLPKEWSQVDTHAVREEGISLEVYKYLVPDTTPGVETEVQVVVQNRSPIALPYYWRTNVTGGSCNNSGMKLRVIPPKGVFSPLGDTAFRVCIQPSAAKPLAAVLNLFLEGLPTPLLSTEETLFFSSSTSLSRLLPNDVEMETLPQFSRTRRIPALPDCSQVDQMTDLCNMFEHYTQLQPEDSQGVFATGFYLFADPTPPCLVMVPDRLEEVVECLVHQSNMRRITLQNKSSKLLHFFFDPTPAECPPEVLLSLHNCREGIEVKFQPRKGSIPPHSTIAVTFSFTLRASGSHCVSFDCYIPELMELLTCTPMSSEKMKISCSHQLHLSVTGVGPSVRASTDLLDFGLIALGEEAESSFTVTNDNSISVVFSLHDPMMRKPPRFVFLPPSFHLGAGESVEVTVYRRAVDLKDSQTFFELVVEEGGILAIETHAIIQAPLLVLKEPVVNFGVVPDGASVEQNLVLSNTSAFDIPYTVEIAALPPCVQIFLPPPGLVPAGQHGVDVPVRCIFTFSDESSGGSDCKGTLRIKNACVQQEILVGIQCESVHRLTVALDLIPIPKEVLGSAVVASARPVLPPVIPPPPVMDDASYIKSLLWNLVNLKVFNNNSDDNNNLGSLGSLVKGGDSFVAFAGAGSMKGGLPSFVRPYCPDVVLKAQFPDGEPLWSGLMGLRVSNLSGCHGFYAIKALFYGVYDDTDWPKTILSSLVSGTKPDFGVCAREHTDAPATLAAAFPDTLNTCLTDRNKKIDLTLINTSQASFCCKSVDGTEQLERKRRVALADAQELLLDGRGCATTLGDLSAGPLHPHAAPNVAISMLANLPGKYEEKLVVCCGDLPPAQIPVTLELTGKPVLLDCLTAGRTVMDGKEVLLMPAVIAGVGRSRRTLTLINRVPRDLNVLVRMFLSRATFSVVAVDDEVEAGAVTLRLESVSEEEQKRESDGKGQVAVAPESFFMPAMASREVIIEYAPDARFMTLPETEKEWHGGIIITAEVADTAFNDRFLIDEFYRIHATRYRAKRIIKTKRVREKEPTWMKSIVRPIVALKVLPSLLSRPGVVRNHMIVPPTASEIAAIKNALDVSSGSSTFDSYHLDHQRRGSKSGTNESSDDDDDNGAGVIGGSQLQERVSCRPLEEIFADEEERMALRAFMAQRHLKQVEDSQRYFIPIELELRARCGIARLVVEPSGEVVRFPTYIEGQPCRKSLLLTNASCAMMEFIMCMTLPLFRIISTRLIPTKIEHNGEDVEEGGAEVTRETRGRSKKGGNQTGRRGTHSPVSSRGRQRMTKAGSTTVKMAKFSFSYWSSTIKDNCISCDSDDAFVTVTKYQLRPHDALEVVVEYCSPSTDEMNASMARSDTAEASLDILYVPANSLLSEEGEEMGDQQKESKRQHDDPLLSPPPVVELKQSISLSITLSPPSVNCTPSTLRFLPGQLLHDGRPQPSYAQKLQLLNFFSSEVSFTISPSCFSSTTSQPRAAPVKDSAATSNSVAPSICDRSDTRQPIPQLLTRGQRLKGLTRYWDAGGDGDDGDEECKNDELDAEVQGDVEFTQQSHHDCQLKEQDELGGNDGRKRPKRQQLQPPVVEDASRFIITPTQGTIPAATRGGQPGVFEVAVRFKEYGNVCFSAAFNVFINDRVDNTCSFTLWGGSRETEI